MISPEISKTITALAKNKKWLELRSFFTFADSEDEWSQKCIAWCRFFMPTMFSDPTPLFHYDLVKRLLSLKNEYVAVPRGFAKTSLAQGVICFLAAHRMRNFVVIVEKSYREATEVLSVVRDTFTDNPLVLGVYGNLSKTDQRGNEKEHAKETEGDLLINGTRFRAKGFETPIRGLKSGAYRPDFVLVDDVEEDEHVRSEDQRRKYRENFTQGIIPALDIGGQVKVIGTILHNDSLLKSLIDTHNGIILRAFDPVSPETTLLWPERWTYPRLMEKKAQMELTGSSSKFAQEYLNQPLDDESRHFHWQWLQGRYKDSDVSTKTFNRYITLDVADAKGEKNDYTFLTVVDWDSDNNWYVKYAKQKRVDILELVTWIFDVWQYWKPNKIGVEKNAFEYQIRPLLKQRSEELGVFPVVEELPDGGRSKENRVVGSLQGRFQSGKIFFNADAKDDTSILISQLYDFPRGKFDDGADALAYISLLGSRPFSQKGRDDLLPVEHREFFELRSKQKKSIFQSIVSRL